MSPYDTKLIKHIINVTTVLAFIGFVFFLIGRKLDKKDNIVRILGLLDLLSNICIVGLYILAIFSFGL